MKVVVAPDKFKGCLSARDVAAAIARGIAAVDPAIDVAQIPMADGGEGTVDALVAATDGGRVTRTVTGPLPDMRVDATFGMLGDGETAVIEMAAASGLALLRTEQYNPENTTTYGTGELIMAAVREGASHIILGIGGSATTDGGIGCAQACGVEFEMTDGTVRQRDSRPLTGGDVAGVKRVLPSRSLVDQREGLAIRVACDVDNPLYGPRGAARVFGPQKGATNAQVERLDAALERLASVVGKRDVASVGGAGAAGGLGFGMMAFLRARLDGGFAIVGDAVGLRRRVAGAHLVITGEGRLDASSLGGKTAVGVARICRELGVPCVGLAGGVGDGAERAVAEGMSAYFSICDRPMTLAESVRDAAELLARGAGNVVRLARAGKLSC
jgi:glycerate kinase